VAAKSARFFRKFSSSSGDGGGVAGGKTDVELAREVFFKLNFNYNNFKAIKYYSFIKLMFFPFINNLYNKKNIAIIVNAHLYNFESC
jgi:hypothetical protein